MEVTIEDLKRQLRVDYEEEDDLIAMYGEAAENVVVKATNRSLEELKAIGDGALPLPIRVAILKMAAEMFTNRGITTQGNVSVVPYGFEALIKPYVKLGERKNDDKAD